jgi:predicted ATPase
VAQICQRLDGLPLGIELAAARVNAFDVTQIAARLDDRFRLLTQGSRTALSRHQTLRAVVDWSYELLNDPQRQLFDRLAVFVGGLTLEVAEAVCTEPEDRDGEETVAGLLAQLIDKSLVVPEITPAATRRYRMLETLRAYGLDRLDERGETCHLRQRHAAYFLTLVESAGDLLRAAEQTAWLQRLETEQGNTMTALRWSIEQDDAETAMRLAGALYPMWDRQGQYSISRPWLDRVLAMQGPVQPRTRARALLGAGLAAMPGS